MFSMSIPVKSRVITFRGEMICEDIPADDLLFFVFSEGLLLDVVLGATPRLDGFGLLATGFFIEARVVFAKKVEAGH
jgi:hypothetical protein